MPSMDTKTLYSISKHFLRTSGRKINCSSVTAISDTIRKITGEWHIDELLNPDETCRGYAREDLKKLDPKYILRNVSRLLEAMEIYDSVLYGAGEEVNAIAFALTRAYPDLIGLLELTWGETIPTRFVELIEGLPEYI